MATAQLYHHCAPSPEVQVVAKAMIRLLRSHDEVQAVVLNAIASMTSSRRKSRNSMFEPFLRDVFTIETCRRIFDWKPKFDHTEAPISNVLPSSVI